MDYYDTKEFGSEDTYYLTDNEGGLFDNATIRAVPDDIFEDIILDEEDNYVGEPEPEEPNWDERMEHLDDLFESMCIEFVKDHWDEPKTYVWDIDKNTWTDQYGFTHGEWGILQRKVLDKYLYNVETHNWELKN